MLLFGSTTEETQIKVKAFTLKRINELEVAFLKGLGFSVRVSASTYAKYYFQLRSMRPSLKAGEFQSEKEKPFDLEDARKLEVLDETPGVIGSSSDVVAEGTSVAGARPGGADAAGNFLVPNFTRPRRRSNTMGGGEAREVIERHIKHGYQFSDKAPTAASVEQVVNLNKH